MQTNRSNAKFDPVCERPAVSCSLVFATPLTEKRTTVTHKFLALRHGKHRVRLYAEHVAELARPAPLPPKGGVISRFGKIAPLKKLILSERDKGNINLKVDISAHSGGQCPPQGSFGTFGYLGNEYQEIWKIIKFCIWNPRKDSVPVDIGDITALST